MTMPTEADKTNEKSAILRELDELMEYIDADESQETEDLIDPAFFIGNMHDGGPDVPTLTAVVNEPAPEQNKQEEVQKQPGLFSARVEHFKQQEEQKIEPNEVQTEEAQPQNSQTAAQVISDDFTNMVDALVAEHMPKIEAQLRDKITDYLQGKKSV